MPDILLVLAAAILAVAAAILARYLLELHKAQREYEKARDAVEDIVLSFNRQFKRTAERLEFVAYKVEANASRSDRAADKVEEVEKQLRALDERFGSSSEEKNRVLARVDEVDQRVRDVTASQESLSTRILGLEEQAKKLSAIPEPNVEAVIPIRRDKALAPLTGTELAALEMLAAEGPKTAPEIRWRVRLSREHTARLMKKLYEEGYLERDPSKIPFKYSVKKEMEKLLKKTEGQAA